MKHYKTKSGSKVRIICSDCYNSEYPVIALVTDKTTGEEFVETYTKDLKVWACGDESTADLVEVSEWDDFEIDAPVITEAGFMYHFAGVDTEGCPTVWLGGRTSHTQIGRLTCESVKNP